MSAKANVLRSLQCIHLWRDLVISRVFLVRHCLSFHMTTRCSYTNSQKIHLCVKMTTKERKHSLFTKEKTYIYTLSRLARTIHAYDSFCYFKHSFLHIYDSIICSTLIYLRQSHVQFTASIPIIQSRDFYFLSLTFVFMIQPQWRGEYPLVEGGQGGGKGRIYPRVLV